MSGLGIKKKEGPRPKVQIGQSVTGPVGRHERLETRKEFFKTNGVFLSLEHHEEGIS